MAQSFFEATPQQKQLAVVGRAMMDMSERADCAGMKDQDFRLLNDLSHVGNMLTKIGMSFGPRVEDFTPQERDLIKRFMQKEIDIPQMRSYTV